MFSGILISIATTLSVMLNSCGITLPTGILPTQQSAMDFKTLRGSSSLSSRQEAPLVPQQANPMPAADAAAPLFKLGIGMTDEHTIAKLAVVPQESVTLHS